MGIFISLREKMRYYTFRQTVMPVEFFWNEKRVKGLKIPSANKASLKILKRIFHIFSYFKDSL